ncbi:g5536 [Coccomyxa elongata]
MLYRKYKPSATRQLKAASGVIGRRFTGAAALGRGPAQPVLGNGALGEELDKFSVVAGEVLCKGLVQPAMLVSNGLSGGRLGTWIQITFPAPLNAAMGGWCWAAQAGRRSLLAFEVVHLRLWAGLSSSSSSGAQPQIGPGQVHASSRHYWVRAPAARTAVRAAEGAGGWELPRPCAPLPASPLRDLTLR